ncbi:MAG TPA: Maf family protein [Rhizomicrobium sp.]|jgi:septum formation protein|nr:Maf family protein [Rhizomicrobium sp.]
MSGLVLASASASRAALLRGAGVEFQVSPADLDEAALMKEMEGAETAKVATAIAGEKARYVSRRHRGAWVLGGDTMVEFAGAWIDKCQDMAAAEALLRRLSGQSHLLVSAAVLARDGVVLWSLASPVRLTMRRLSDGFLKAYLAKEGEALLSTVGCYRLEGLGAQLFETVEGDYFSVLGLPLLPVLEALRMQGILPS